LDEEEPFEMSISIPLSGVIPTGEEKFNSATTQTSPQPFSYQVAFKIHREKTDHEIHETHEIEAYCFSISFYCAAFSCFFEQDFSS